MDVRDTFETVLLGPLLGDRLRYWGAGGTAQLAAVDDAAGLGALMARGVLARTGPEPHRFREVALHDRATSALLALGRVLGTDAATAVADAASFQLTPSAIDPAVDLWAVAADWWADAVVSAVGRGEFLVIEPGGWAPGSEPYALAMARIGEDGAWQSYLEAAPAPPGPHWPEPAGKGTSIHAPLSTENAAGAGFLLGAAVRPWAATPFDTVVTYGASPDGPFTDL